MTHEFATHKQSMDRAAHGLSKAERGTLIESLKGSARRRASVDEGDKES